MGEVGAADHCEVAAGSCYTSILHPLPLCLRGNSRPSPWCSKHSADLVLEICADVLRAVIFRKPAATFSRRTPKQPRTACRGECPSSPSHTDGPTVVGRSNRTLYGTEHLPSGRETP
jgi:hypothetical protein